MDYDPSLVSYEELLQMFWANHSPQYRPYSRQYASIILYHDEEQKRLAEASKAREEAHLGRNVYTEIRPVGTFYWAEDYHQKYYLQHQPSLMSELRARYPDFEDFVNSTEAARANGSAGGFCPAPEL
jgi:peptide methionine sulfoxide reductase MsrA